MLASITSIHGGKSSSSVSQSINPLAPKNPIQTKLKLLKLATLKKLTFWLHKTKTFFCYNLQKQAQLAEIDSIPLLENLSSAQNLTEKYFSYISAICNCSESLLHEIEITLTQINNPLQRDHLPTEEILYAYRSIRFVQLNIETLFETLNKNHHRLTHPFQTDLKIKNILIATYRNLTTAFYNLEQAFPWLEERRAETPFLGIPKNNFGNGY
jgi:hypothetical protein